MAAATDLQVQSFVDQRVRPRCEQIRALYLACKADSDAIGDVYAALNVGEPTWSDSRTDGPPHLVTPNDVLAFNTFIVGFIKFIEGTFSSQGDGNTAHGQYPVVLNACVRPVQG